MTETAKTENSDSTSSGATENDSKPDLESLLAGYGKGGGKAATTGAPDGVLDEIKSLRADLAQRDYRDAMDDIVIPTLKGDMNVPTDYVEYWANKAAEADPRLLELWDDRKNNPTAFKEAIDALAPKFAESVTKQFGGGDPKKLLSTVKSSRETDGSPADSFDEVNWPSLSDTDFELKKRELFRAVERGAS